MKRILLLWSCLVWILSLPAYAQKRGEISVFGGYSHVWNTDTIHGWNASIAGNLTKYLALVGDFSGQYRTTEYAGYGYQTYDTYRNYSFLFGPRYIHTIQKRWTPFAHALFGLQRYTSEGGYTLGPTSFSYGPFSYNNFAMAFGGGIDIKLNNRVSIRALQLDGVGITDFSAMGTGYYIRASFGAVYCLKRGAE